MIKSSVSGVNYMFPKRKYGRYRAPAPENPERVLKIAYLRLRRGAKMADIGAEVGITPAAVGQLLRRWSGWASTQMEAAE